MPGESPFPMVSRIQDELIFLLNPLIVDLLLKFHSHLIRDDIHTRRHVLGPDDFCLVFARYFVGDRRLIAFHFIVHDVIEPYSGRPVLSPFNGEFPPMAALFDYEIGPNTSV